MDTTTSPRPALSAALVREISRLRPWLNAVAGTGFVVGVFLAILPAVLLFGPLGGAIPGNLRMLLAGVAALLLVWTLWPSWLLLRSARALGRAGRQVGVGVERDMLEALRSLRAYWRFTGVISASLVTFQALAILAAVILELISGEPPK